MAVVEELSQQFNGWLSPVYLKGRHVHVVYEDDCLLAHGWPEEALATLVHSRHDDELRAKESAKVCIYRTTGTVSCMLKGSSSIITSQTDKVT